LIDTAKVVAGGKTSQKRKEWISEKTVQLAVEKREVRLKDTGGYKELKAAVQRSVRDDKQKYPISVYHL